jgi:hypothetical protein
MASGVERLGASPRLLRYFAAGAMIQYAAFRDDIITGAGAKDYDYDTAIERAYGMSNPGIRHAIDAWNVIDKSLPDDATKEAIEREKIIQDSQRKSHQVNRPRQVREGS